MLLSFSKEENNCLEILTWPHKSMLWRSKVFVKTNSSVLDFWENFNSVLWWSTKRFTALEDRSVNVGRVRPELPGLSA